RRAALDDECRVEVAESLPLPLVGEDDVRRERLQPGAECVVDARPRTEVDAEACAAGAGESRRMLRCGRQRLALERVPGDVERVAAEPLRLELVGAQAR